MGGDNVTARAPAPSAPCGVIPFTRTPPNIDRDGFYNRFAKERSKREVCCDSDSCRQLFKGNNKGDFVDPLCQKQRERSGAIVEARSAQRYMVLCSMFSRW